INITHQQSQIGTISQLVAGGVAGTLSKTCTAPLSHLAVLFQASKWHEASQIVREEGIRAFWKGNLVTIAHRLPFVIKNWLMEFVFGLQLLHKIPGLESRKENRDGYVFVHFLGGGMAGDVFCSFHSSSSNFFLNLSF
ncbi:Calcium-binding mitochondrial carrier protein SCaMC-2, partial [Linum perenne]